MTPERLAKVRRLAEDIRGDPAIRAVAQRILAAHSPPPPRPINPRHPGLRTSKEYDRYVFLNLDTWNETRKGNYVTFIGWKGRSYRVILFRHKRTPTWGWLRIDPKADTEEWGSKYDTVREALDAAWIHLMLV